MAEHVICGVVGQGKTKAEARQDAEEKIRKAFDGGVIGYEPVVLRAGAVTGVLARTPWGFTTKVVADNGTSEVIARSTKDYDEAIRRLRWGMATALFNGYGVMHLSILHHADIERFREWADRQASKL